MDFVVDHTGGQLLDVAIARDTSDQQDQAEEQSQRLNKALERAAR
jgi:hypothetical protein